LKLLARHGTMLTVKQKIKTMLKQKIKTIVVYKVAKVPLFVLVILLLFASIALPRVRADSVTDQINALEQQNNANQNTVAQLQTQATSYQDAVNKLQAEITALQGQINANTAQQVSLQGQITTAEADLAKQKAVLGENIKQMYLDGDISTLEMLASSKDLSDFVDKQQGRNAVQNKIKTTLDKINDLKHQLQDQKSQIDLLLKQEQDDKAKIDSAYSQQSQLLAYNQQQQADYNQQTKDNQSKIDALVASQRRANFNPDGGYYFLHFPGPVQSFNPDSYPYRNAGFGMSPGIGCSDNDGPDPWGYCTRQCVSYTAWAVLASGRSSRDQISGWGNARDWVAAAYAHGIPVSRTPQPGDIAISTSGYWGHAMYVQGVSGNTFSTSEYNTYLTGQLSYQTRSY
jgi:peptidoglycan hydrolase CwlO-like protein